MIWNSSELSTTHLSHDTSIFMLIAANLAQARCLGWKWSLWPVPTWLALQRSKSVFLNILYDIINDMKHFWTVCTTLEPCRSLFRCWLLKIWPELVCWAENGAYSLCWLGWRYNGAKLSFSWSYMIVSMVWITSELTASHVSRATAIFVVDCCQLALDECLGKK